jgi:hypothetical protein
VRFVPALFDLGEYINSVVPLIFLSGLTDWNTPSSSFQLTQRWGLDSALEFDSSALTIALESLFVAVNPIGKRLIPVDGIVG